MLSIQCSEFSIQWLVFTGWAVVDYEGIEAIVVSALNSLCPIYRRSYHSLLSTRYSLFPIRH